MNKRKTRDRGRFSAGRAAPCRPLRRGRAVLSSDPCYRPEPFGQPAHVRRPGTANRTIRRGAVLHRTGDCAAKRTAEHDAGWAESPEGISASALPGRCRRCCGSQVITGAKSISITNFLTLPLGDGREVEPRSLAVIVRKIPPGKGVDPPDRRRLNLTSTYCITRYSHWTPGASPGR